jgi:UDPglucose 6-dehydrogenase
MRIAVVGTGYVGLVAGTCLSDTGQFVTCVDLDPAKVEQLSRGEPTIYEPGLKELLTRNLDAGRLTFTTDLACAVAEAGVIFVAVGTPPAEDGSADLSAVRAVAADIAHAADEHKIVVMKSTVPVGTHREITDLLNREASVGIDYVSNPEFLKEGNAIEDFTRPDRVIVGASNPQAAKTVAHLYSPFMRRGERIIVTDPASAELAKYAANTMLAMRISFVNEIARLCDAAGADVEAVRRCVGSDRRIGSSFLFPGLGYGGHCFPKDVQAFMTLARRVDTPSSLAEATHEANLKQPEYFRSIVTRALDGVIAGRHLAVWGLAYKARTDDVRMSPAVAVVRWLVEQGATVSAHDPQAMEKAKAELGEAAVGYRDGMYDMLDGAEALLVLTEWQEFRSPDFDEVKRLLKRPLVIDGRNLYDPEEMRAAGFKYFSVGRPAVE